ncbi:serine-rich coiled-coil domain-containing protein 2 isoform X2 [Dromaius novaehollandiae]|uniref:serine-rich coiled-coil domain-containing protein 2 isoform X2 n=1 Tax=Dromaius novaehollandiae TaxID=8790 RepID=UPI00311FA835
MEEKNQIRTSLVSRLPKYGTKTLGSVLQPMPNGTAVSLSGNNGDKNFSRHNGTVHMSSFSFNWRKSNKYQLCDQNGRESNSNHNCNEKLVDSEKYPQSQGALGKDVLRVGLNNTASVASKTAKKTNMFVSSTEELNPKSLPGLSSSAKFAKGTLSGRTSYSGLSAPKSHLNGFYGNRPMVGLQRSRANSSATRTSSGESLAQSTDNSKTFSCEKMVRSQSFSHSMPNSFLPTASLTRSHSFNKAVDLTKPYQNQNLAVRTSQRSTLLSRNARQLDVPNGNEPAKYGFTRPYAGVSASCSKKPPLSNISGSAPSFGYRLSRPSLLKPTRQRFAGNIVVDDSRNTTPDTCVVENSEISTNINRAIEKNSIIESETRRTESGEALHDSIGKHGSKVMCMSDDGDEISISSLSSSEKNDLSEDFSDDFIDLEDPNRTIQIQQKEGSVQELEHGNITPIEPFTSLKESGGSHCNTDDWLDIHVSDDNSESTKQTTENMISPDMNYRAGSSFELSPSDSSDGTYMWDEEGLEPIGSVHPCGSYESSEMNSIDILNNLDSCDLDDDDLMLDVDLPEDPPHDNEECENMSRYDRQDRNARQHPEGFWKRPPQQRWNTQDHYHLGNTDHYMHDKNDLNRGSNYLESPIGHFESFGAPNFYQAPRQLVGLPENTVMLDEMTLRHMVQDCTAVKTQLLKLKRLLHQNDENVSLQDIPLSIPSSPEPQEAESTFKTEDLLNEIRQLKDELKKKDETINRLEHQLATRCNCQKDNEKLTGATCLHADKFTQTSWRRSSPQVLQPSSNLPSSTDLAQGKLIKMPHTEAHSEYPKHGLHENGNHKNQNAANASLTNSLNELNTLMSIQLNIKDENASYLENLKNENAEDPGELASIKEGILQSRSFYPTSTRADIREVQTELAVKGQPSFTNQASWPKTLGIVKPPNALVPPTVAALTRSANHSAASKEPELLPSSSPTRLEPTSGQTNLKGKQSQKVSKLRPPTMSFVKSKQTSSQKSTLVSPEPQNTCSKTNIPKPPVQRKENVHIQSTGLHSGDSLPSNRHSRLPKPKTH